MIRKKLDFGRIIIGIVLIGFAFLCLIPFYYILMVSFSDPALVKEGEVILFPKGFSTKAYEMIIRDQKFFRGFGVSVFRTDCAMHVCICGVQKTPGRAQMVYETGNICRAV